MNIFSRYAPIVAHRPKPVLCWLGWVPFPMAALGAKTACFTTVSHVEVRELLMVLETETSCTVVLLVMQISPENSFFPL